MTFWAVVSFPVWLAVAYTSAYTVLYLRGGKQAVAAFGARGYFLFPLFLMPLVVAVIMQYDGASWWRLWNSAHWQRNEDSFAWMLAIAAGGGALLHALETLFVRLTSKRVAPVLPPASLFILLPVSLAIAIGEEIIWRGYLLQQLQALGWSLAAAATASAVLFGLHHYAFGWRGILFKALSAGFWTLLVIHYDSLLPAVVAHFSADCILWCRNARRQPTQPTTVEQT